ncbi:nuclear RNA export factor 1-like [Achroia grisella]|uniref:nuclear RNA export factor 1-like n=1 Tax=Achroia grisella TaxID=688607 RepID=UPI0027D21008|nr:nuclear RNA export factor 1-like [Achroia grisella]
MFTINTQKYQLYGFSKFLLNRNTVTSEFIDRVQICLSNEEDVYKHYFHKIMVHNWSGSPEMLYDTMSEFYGTTLIPVNYTLQGDISSFYSSSLMLILKIINSNFMFPSERNMYNIDILLNDKTSKQCFEERVTIEDIVNGVVSKRFSENLELDLSNICNDLEFIEKKIYFYKIGLLNHFKILMLRMGRDTKILNLSNNNLSEIPHDIMNFFVKGDLVGINLSYNNIMSLVNLHRSSSKLEKIWLEGNPVCEDMDPDVYVRQLIVKFPRVTEIDGIKLCEPGFTFRFSRNYIASNDMYCKMVVEKFITLYYSHYDKKPRKIKSFYDNDAVLTISTSFDGTEELNLDPCYKTNTRNVANPDKKNLVMNNKKYYYTVNSVYSTLNSFPLTVHDLSSFCIDVPIFSSSLMMLVVDGIYKEKRNSLSDSEDPYVYFQFRRTFIFSSDTNCGNQKFTILNDMFSITYATEENISRSFKIPIRNMNILALINPDPEDIKTIAKAFCHITQLKMEEAKLRLKANDWDFCKSLKLFMTELRAERISLDKFLMDDDDFSDISNLSDVD